jgi:phosphoribosylformylglycinamidine cyclo-ligase
MVSGKRHESLYAKDGVNVEDESDFSAYAGGVCRESYRNSQFVKVHDLSGGSFRGPRPYTLVKLPLGYLTESSADGIGTKGVLIDAAKMHESAAYDLMAMVTSDITRYGGIPLAMTNILDVAAVGEPGSTVSETYRGLMRGLAAAAREARVVILKGETAQMGVCLGSEMPNSPTRFNWGAVMTGAYTKEKMITGKTLKAGQVIIALQERGFRCNGISSVRAAFRKQYGDAWWSVRAARDDIRAAAAPSVLYDRFVNSLHGWYAKGWKPQARIHAVAHLSGGGIKEKLGKDILFPRGLSAELDTLFTPPDIMLKCKTWRGMSDEEMYVAWNGGQGMLLMVSESDVDTVLKSAPEFGIVAQVAGRITKEAAPQIVVRSQASATTFTYRS